jgi:hypothetical protein
MKKYGGVDVEIHVFLTSALVGGEWSASRPGLISPGKELPLPIGPQSRSGRHEEVKILAPIGT